tara:strand:+ start:1186 stop:1407 length:222 start_codon:yes stop_codon:yes gene_type:complete
MLQVKYINHTGWATRFQTMTVKVISVPLLLVMARCRNTCLVCVAPSEAHETLWEATALQLQPHAAHVAFFAVL